MSGLDRFDHRESRDIGKKMRKPEKLERISGIGNANKKFIKECLKAKNPSKDQASHSKPQGHSFLHPGIHQTQQTKQATSMLSELDEFEIEAETFSFIGESEDLGFDAKWATKLKLDQDFFEKIEDDFDNDLE